MIKLIQSQQRRQLEGLDEFSLFCSERYPDSHPMLVVNSQSRVTRPSNGQIKRTFGENFELVSLWLSSPKKHFGPNGMMLYAETWNLACYIPTLYTCRYVIQRRRGWILKWTVNKQCCSCFIIIIIIAPVCINKWAYF